MSTRCLFAIVVLISQLITLQAAQALPIGDQLDPVASATPQTTTYYVDAVNGSNAGDGSAATPWKTITYALTQVSANDILMVAPGTYSAELGEVFPITLKPGVRIVGASPNSTIINGVSDQVVVYANGAAMDYDSSTQISRVTLQGGYIGLYAYATQGRILHFSVDQVRTTQNIYGIHFATSNVYEYGATISPIIANTEIMSNSQAGIYLSSYGYFSPSDVSPVITNCLVAFNGGDGLLLLASAVSLNGSSTNPQITNTHIHSNAGHGINASGSYHGWVRPRIERSWIERNGGYGFIWTQGVNRGMIDGTMVNSIVQRNLSGGLYIGDRSEYYWGAFRIINSTIVDNSSYGVYWLSNDVRVQLSVVNSIIWNPAADDFNVAAPSLTPTELSYSDVKDGDLLGQLGNVSIDPHFADPVHGDYHLLPASPVLNLGDNSVSDLPLNDLDGDLRVQNDTVDIGADESQPYVVSLSQTVMPLNTVRIGEGVTYTLTITNQSAWSAGGPLVTATLPAEVMWNGDAIASTGYVTVTNNSLRWTGTLPASSVQTVTYRATVKPGLPVGTIITNVSTIDNRTGGITATSPVTLTVGPSTRWDTSAQRVDTPDAQPGQRITYTLMIRNTGNVPAYDAILTDTLDSHVTFATAEAGGVWDTDRVVWNGLTVDNGTAITLTVAVTINTPLSDTTPIVNQVNVSGGQSSFALPIVTTTAYNSPLADFDAMPTLGAVPFNVTFTDRSQHATGYLWTYGDGASSAVDGDHQHSYNTAGFYTVTLRVSNPIGSNSLTRTTYITAYNAANAYFTGNPTTGLWPLTVNFTNTSANADQFIWDYGDGLTSTITSPAHSHQYAAPGFYTVTLTAIGPYDQNTYTRISYVRVYEPPSANFTALPRSGVSPLLVGFTNYSLNTTAYRWDFGDGSIAYSVNPNHYYFESGAYTVTLTAYNPGGEDTLIRSAYITVYAPPVAGFTGTPLSGQIPLTVTFTNTSSAADSYAWDYGDGQTSPTTAPTHTHTYAQPGTFAVKLTAFNAHGQNTLTRSSYVTVYALPLADFSASPLTGTSPLTVSFVNQSQNADSFRWNFGDGATAVAVNPVHAYAAGGVYTVSLQAGNPGGSMILTRTAYITVNQGPIADFTASPRLGSEPLMVTFTNTSIAADAYAWDYGDGITSTAAGLTHSHVYAAMGNYTVTLTALNSYGINRRVRSAYVTVHPTTTAALYYVDAENGNDQSGNGSVSSPWKTITHALSQLAGINIEIRVASGVYDQVLGESFPIIMKSGVSLIGTGYPDTIIAGNNSTGVVQFVNTSVYSTATVLRGFKITDGLEGVHIDGTSGVGTAPLIEANWITGNATGIMNYAYSGQQIQAVVRDNLITANSQDGVAIHANYGVAYAAPNLIDNLISHNGSVGVRCYALGAGDPYNNEYGVCAPTLTHNILADNASDGYLCYTLYAGGCHAVLNGNLIVRNGGWGVGRYHEMTYLYGSYSRFYNNVIADNASGGAVFSYGVGTFGDRDAPVFVNNTIIDNHAYGVVNGYPTLVNNIVWGHTTDLNAPVSSTSYNDVSQGIYAGQNGNISANPQFVGRATGDYHVHVNSPVIDTGDSTVADLPITDLDGNPRIMGDSVDMGAYELPLELTGSIGMTPNPVMAGQVITFNLQITNTDVITLHTIITDVRSPHVTPTNPLTWTAIITPRSVWSRAITATVVPDYAGPITNTLQVTSLEGPSGLFAATTQALIPVSGLFAVNNGPTVLGQPTILTATITGGSAVTYTWSLGDMTTDFGASITHTYPLTGTYIAVVTASNSVSAMTGSTTVLVTAWPLSPRAYLPLIMRSEP